MYLPLCVCRDVLFTCGVWVFVVMGIGYLGFGYWLFWDFFCAFFYCVRVFCGFVYLLVFVSYCSFIFGLVLSTLSLRSRSA